MLDIGKATQHKFTFTKSLPRTWPCISCSDKFLIRGILNTLPFNEVIKKAYSDWNCNRLKLLYQEHIAMSMMQSLKYNFKNFKKLASTFFFGKPSGKDSWVSKPFLTGFGRELVSGGPRNCLVCLGILSTWEGVSRGCNNLAVLGTDCFIFGASWKFRHYYNNRTKQ